MAFASMALALASGTFALLAGMFAAPPPDSEEPDAVDLPPSADAPEPGARETAKQAFDAGLTAVAAGEYEVAISAFERAYRLRPHTVTLFNLALALEKAGRRPEAWELFDDIVDVVESNAERREVRRHMRAIEA